MGKGFMIAATGSGCGKTTMTIGILMAMKQRGLHLQSFKCGPDYIDPMFHSHILDVPANNLDVFFQGKTQLPGHFRRLQREDWFVVESVMGLYDGMHPSSLEGSSYEIADLLDLPIILIVDGKGMGRSMLGVIRGFLDMDVHHRIAGVILNKVSTMYYQIIKPVIQEELHIPVLGCFPVQKDLVLESRYLGLKLPEEVADLQEQAEELGRRMETFLDLDALLSLAQEGPQVPPQKIEVHAQYPVRIAVAKDAAFCFYYQDNLKLFEAMHATLVPFSPLEDETVPENCQGLILGGGYPELYAKALQGNASMRNSIRQCIQQGMPSLAECGGFLYLHEKLEGPDGQEYDGCGILPGTCRNQGKLVRFGYVSMEEKQPHFLGSNEKIRGHEFHYYDCEENGSDALAVKPVTGRSWEAAWIGENHWWGFAHLYYLSNPGFVEHFLQKCMDFQSQGTQETELM